MVRHVPGEAMTPLPEWLGEIISPQAPQDYLERLAHDGFGLVVKILRDIKSSWKLLLGEMEDFLEELDEAFDDDKIITIAPYLHRTFVSYIDFFQRQLFYHARYVSYLLNHTGDSKCIYPEKFRPDISQENDALKVLDIRLKALRNRTMTMLEMILSLTNIKQTRLSSEILVQQRQDAAQSYRQGESLRRLTFVTIAYLPPSFVATAYGMNTQTTHDTQIWTFVLIAIFFTFVTLIVANIRVHPKIKEDTEKAKTGTPIPQLRRPTGYTFSFHSAHQNPGVVQKTMPSVNLDDLSVSGLSRSE
ncbi:MAG: hypothetical protein Q9167_006986 [Letrouitia subvulpina]